MQIKMIAVSLMFALCCGANAMEADKVRVGKLLKASDNSLELEVAGGMMSIGFAAHGGPRRALHKMKLGQEIRAVFGTVRLTDGVPINELLSVRACVPGERECAEDRARGAREAEEAAKESDLRHQAQRRCEETMERTLLSDSRYVPRTASVALPDAFSHSNALRGEERTCAEKVFKQHSRAVFDACELHRCGDNIGGGCSHLAGYALHSAVAEKAVAMCRK